MPVVTVNVLRVSERFCRTAQGFKKKYDVATTYRAPLHGGTFETWNPLIASLCERAWKVGRSVRIGYRDLPKWGSEIVTAELLDVQETQGAA